MTSPYALQEAERNIQNKKPEALERLSRLARSVEVSSAVGSPGENHGLLEKDRPILESAVGCGCSVLLTGDITHFGHLIGTEAEGVQVMTVSMFLSTR